MLKKYTERLGIAEGWIYKLLLVMRLTTIILIAMMMQVSGKGLAQTLSFSKTNSTYKEVFDQIRTQLGYDVVWPSRKFDAKRAVDVNFKNASIEKVLEQTLQGQDVSYTIRKKVILLTVKEKTFIEKIKEVFSAIDVRGKVVDESGHPLPGASVKVKNGSQSGVSDKDGEFLIKNVPEEAVLEITYLGFRPLELHARANMGTLQMEMLSAGLNEVVISKGYYNTTKELNTGSVSRVDAKTIEKQPVTSFMGALSGRMAGVSISQSNGIPGSDFNIEIRGRNSLRTDGNAPLYIVDGVPFSTEKVSASDNTVGIYGGGGVSPLASINAADIENVEILKDADATAIYGSRGANGVVLITTKKGKSGKTKFDLNVYNGAGKVNHLKMLSTQDYLAMRKEAYANDGFTTTYPADAYDLNGAWDQNRYTDWQDVLIGGLARSTSVQGSLSGGNENTQFLFSTGYRKETSVFPGDLGFQKGSVHFSVNNSSADKKFVFSASITGSLDRNDQVNLDFTNEARRLAPNAPELYTADGKLNWANSTWNNPLAELERSYEGKVNNLIGNAMVGYELLPGLKIKSNFGINTLESKEFNAYPSTAFNPASNLTSARSEVRYSTGSNFSWVIEPQLTYERQIAKGQLSLLLGSTLQDQRLDKVTNHYQDFTSNGLLRNFSSAARSEAYDIIKTIYRYNALFGRINYNWESKYVLNLTARRDGSSRFGPGKQFSNFGAVGVAWIFSKEKWMEKFGFLSLGKLRGSYGITGNDQIGNYQYLDTYGTPDGNNVYQGQSGLAPTRIFNPDFAWESNKKAEVALELGFLKDRIFLSAAYYRNRSSNQLINYALPKTTGFEGVLANLPATVQNTGLEVELNTVNFRKAFRWETSFNFTLPKNKLIAFPGIESSTYANRYVVGESIYIQRMYEFTGVSPQTGIYTFKDVNGDGVISEADDRRKSVLVGSKFFGGLNNSFSYKGFSLDVFLQFVKQTAFDGQATILGGFLNQPAYLLDKNRWRKVGDVAEVQRLATEQNADANSAVLRYRLSEGAITDASFLRVKNVSFSYQLPSKWLKGFGCRLYVNAQNLFVLTPYEGYDPESQAIRLPPLKMITGGLQFTL